MKRLIAVAGVVAVATAYYVLSALPAFGDESATVTAKVDVASPCVFVTTKSGTGALDFGNLAFSGPTSLATKVLQGDPSWLNCGNGTENIYVKGSDAASGGASPAVWSLFDPGPNNPPVMPCDVGANKYAVNLSFGSGNHVWLSTANQLLDSIPPNSGNGSNTQLRMPCSGSAGAGQTMSFTITFTASL